MYSSGMNAKTNRDMVQATIDKNKIQQRITNYLQGFDEQGNPGEMAKSQIEMKLEQTQAALEAIQKETQLYKAKANTETMTNGLNYWYQGKQEDALKTFKQNPALMEQLKNSPNLDFNNLDVPNFDNPEDVKQLQELGINTSKLNDIEVRDALTSSFMRIQGHDGKWRLTPVGSLMKETNTQEYMTKEQRDLAAERSQHITGIFKGLLPQQQDAANENQLVKTKADTKVTQLSMEEMDSYMKEHPEAKLSDYKAYIASKTATMDPDKYMKELKLKGMQEEQAINNFIYDNPSGFLGTLSKGDIDTKIDGVSLYKIAKTAQGDKKLSTARRDFLDGMISTVKNTGRLRKELESANFNWDAFTKAMDTVSKYTPEQWQSMTPKEKQSMLNRFAFNSDLKTVMAGYIKAMSGAAVSDQERAFYEGAILNGNWANKDAALASMKGFLSGVGNMTKSSLESMKANLPATYLEYKRELPKEEKDYMRISADEIKSMSTQDKINWLKARGVSEDQIRKATR